MGRYGGALPFEKNDDSLCYACKVAGGALDKIVAQEKVLG